MEKFKYQFNAIENCHDVMVYNPATGRYDKRAMHMPSTGDPKDKEIVLDLIRQLNSVQ